MYNRHLMQFSPFESEAFIRLRSCGLVLPA